MTHLVGRIPVLDDPICSDYDSVDIIVLHQRSEHRVAWKISFRVCGKRLKLDVQIIVAGIWSVVSSSEVRRDPIPSAVRFSHAEQRIAYPGDRVWSGRRKPCLGGLPRIGQ
jgi:hypothetical protein